MNIKLGLVKDKQVLFETVNANGSALRMEGPESMGGENMAQSPMETLLSAVAGCSVLDVVHILRKQRQSLEDVRVEVKGERHIVDDVKPFKSIHLHFILVGQIKEKKAERAVSLSVEKYCSVASSLDPNISISHSFEIITT